MTIGSLKDIIIQETVKATNSPTGFSHPSAGYTVSFYNGSAIYTLNSRPDSARSRRATLVFFDEAAFCSDELIAVCEAFAAQNTDFKTSVESDYRPDGQPKQVPTQLVYASSQDSIDKTFYKHYREFAKKMIAGDRDYFSCDMICDTAITVYMNGEEYTPLSDHWNMFLTHCVTTSLNSLLRQKRRVHIGMHSAHELARPFMPAI